MSKKQSIPFGATLDEFRERLASGYETLLASNGQGTQLLMIASVGTEANTDLTFAVRVDGEKRDFGGSLPQASRHFYELVTS